MASIVSSQAAVRENERWDRFIAEGGRTRFIAASFGAVTPAVTEDEDGQSDRKLEATGQLN